VRPLLKAPKKSRDFWNFLRFFEPKWVLPIWREYLNYSNITWKRSLILEIPCVLKIFSNPRRVKNSAATGVMVPNPRVIEYSDDVVFLFHPPHLSLLSPACPSLWQFYYNWSCCECVDCLVHVTSEAESKDPATTSQISQHSQKSLNSSKSGQEDPCGFALLRGQKAHWLVQDHFHRGCATE